MKREIKLNFLQLKVVISFFMVKNRISKVFLHTQHLAWLTHLGTNFAQVIDSRKVGWLTFYCFLEIKNVPRIRSHSFIVSACPWGEKNVLDGTNKSTKNRSNYLKAKIRENQQNICAVCAQSNISVLSNTGKVTA